MHVLHACLRGIERGTALQHLEAIARHQQRPRRLVEPVIGAADALDQPARPLWRADVDDEIDIAPVDAEIEGRGAHHRLEAAVGHRRLDLAPLGGIERAMMQRDRQVILVGLPQLLEQQLGLAAGVDEQQRQAVRLHGGVDLRHGIARGVPGPGQRLTGLHDRDVGLGTAARHHQVGHGDCRIGGGLRHQIGAQLGRPRDSGRQPDRQQPRRQLAQAGEA